MPTRFGDRVGARSRRGLAAPRDAARRPPPAYVLFRRPRRHRIGGSTRAVVAAVQAPLDALSVAILVSPRYTPS
jgi:hypothetical protein